MAGAAKKDEILEVAASSKSPKDLEAEIAAAADAIGGAQTVAGTPIYEIETEPEPVKPKKKAAPKKTTKAKAPAKKKAPSKKAEKEKPVEKVPVKKTPQKKGKVMATSDVRPVPKKPKKVTKATVTSPEKSAPSAVKVTVEAKKRVSDSETEPEKKATLSHQGKKIAPIGDVKKLKAAQKKAIPKRKPATPEPVAVKTSVKVAKAKPAPKREKPYAVVHKKPVEKAAPASHQIKKAKVPTKKLEKHTPHVARIYDTRTYHIPISVDHHHRKAMMPHWAWALVLLLAIAGMVIAGFGFIEF